MATLRKRNHPNLRPLVSPLLPGYRDLEEMLTERGLPVDHSTILRWVQRHAPELDEQCRPHLKQTNDYWRVDETYVKVEEIGCASIGRSTSWPRNLRFSYDGISILLPDEQAT